MQRYLILVCNLLFGLLLCSCDNSQVKLLTEQEYTGYDVSDGDTEKTDIPLDDEGTEAAVYVCGAVVNPGVYYLPADAIKQDALCAAGGFQDGAAEFYVNLAEVVSDGERIYFPYEDELEAGYSPVAEAEEDGRININTASKEELMSLPGIGESKADSLIEYRETCGGFKDIEEIMNIPGIKEGIYNNIKDYIVVN